MTKIVVPIMPTSLEEAKALRAIDYVGADMIEWRADFMPLDLLFKAAPVIFETFRNLPVLFTLRTTEEGGKAAVTDGVYSYILSRILEETPVRYIDVEYFSHGSVLSDLTEVKDKLVLSYHNFKEMPSDLTERLKEMAGIASAVVKVAVSPETPDEVLTFMHYARAFADSYDLTLVAIAMGEVGKATRVLSNLTGSCWTFATAKGAASAPGQYSLDETRQLLGLLGD
ncbi:MAG: type I 3-dehydroquinate dehydratase [Streptococcaceae bacterium]|jgi:3-dehydroquinate dehydratase-1|nr:type I 3-dehydroquinate dehydratase [Streptococcaceae bacterium]